jgi:TPR repeat protein
LYYYGEEIDQDYRKAYKWFLKAAKQSDASSQYYLGNIYYFGEGIKQDYRKAYKWFLKAAKQSDAHSQYALGEIYSEGNGVAQDYVKAEYWFALSFKNGNWDAGKILAYQWAEQGIKLNKAEIMIKKVIDKFPDDGYSLDTLGWIYYKQRKYHQAITQLERAAKLQSDDVKIKKHLGDAYFKLGKIKQAKQQWSKALELTKDEK